MQARFSSLALSFSYKITPPPGGGTPLYKSYRYVPPQRVWFLCHFDLTTGINFAHFGLESGIVFQGTTGVWKYLSFRFQKEYEKKKGKYVTSKCILRNLFYWCSNLSNREIKHRVYGKRQTWICTTWPSFLFTCRLQFIITTRKSVN